MKVTGAYDVESLRTAEYPTWKGDAAFLNAASFGPMPERSRVAIEWLNQAQTDAFAASTYDQHEGLRLSRASIAKLIGTDSAHIALTPNTNVGINIGADLALQRARKNPRGPRVIVVSEREFPANVYPWLALEQHGFTVEFISANEHGHPHEDAIIERISAGDVAVDVLAAGCQKWLCSPWGTGFAYLSDEMLEMQPTLPGWLSFPSSEDYTQPTRYGTDMAVQQPLIDWADTRAGVEISSSLEDEHRSGIVCALREGSIRLSPHFSSTIAEMERVVGVLDEVVPS